jgi:hypothetical protein
MSWQSILKFGEEYSFESLLQLVANINTILEKYDLKNTEERNLDRFVWKEFLDVLEGKEMQTPYPKNAILNLRNELIHLEDLPSQFGLSNENDKNAYEEINVLILADIEKIAAWEKMQERLQ